MLAADLSFTHHLSGSESPTPGCCSRPRSANLLVQDLDKLAQQLVLSDGEWPEAVAALVTEPANENQPCSCPGSAVSVPFSGLAVTPADAKICISPSPSTTSRPNVQLLETHDGVVAGASWHR